MLTSINLMRYLYISDNTPKCIISIVAPVANTINNIRSRLRQSLVVVMSVISDSPEVLQTGNDQLINYNKTISSLNTTKAVLAVSGSLLSINGALPFATAAASTKESPFFAIVNQTSILNERISVFYYNVYIILSDFMKVLDVK